MLFLHLKGGMTPVPSTYERVSTQRKRKTSAKDAAKSSDEKGTLVAMGEQNKEENAEVESTKKKCKKKKDEKS